ncbi:alkaline phosphatase [Salipiger marinus]|jgi:alkaline phosphatase|uniref:alkaline phosphatase n=1 Tax=Salipiger marinus TaxID=555512 RepID=UPI000E90C882|nr:alkaline phosphatase [Salipiger manganoxidans]MCD1620196.1 alkaline phosphatase [Salipiger manganoxidans]MEB3421137.1 alkaline phosphatase [Salipiger manganoxidans]HBT00091.1 alkaline phosphatase [Citreicella sp.]
MKQILLSTAAILGLATVASAQDLPQAGSDWYQAAQDTIAERLAVQPNTATAKNVILFTADGNGVGTNYAIRLFSGQQEGGLGDEYVQPHETFPHVALVKTYSSNGQTPDSAPTAMAMNSGVKGKNGMINIMDTVAVEDCAAGADAGTKLFSEIATEMGKSVGVISTARITHATPAAVYARTVSRDWEDNSALPEGCEQKDIAAQLIDQMQAGVIDVAFGGGRAHFLPTDVTDVEGKTGKRTDGRNLVEEATGLGAQVVFGEEDFSALTAGNNAPILGLFEASHMKYEHDRTGEPSLAEMTEAAIEALSTNDEGFYLSIEAGRVDHANHEGNLYRVLADGKAFADAIAKAMELTNAEDTLIIVTADHEHAISFNGYCGRGSNIVGLCMEENEAGIEHNGTPNLGADGKPYTVAGYLNGAGSVLIEQADGTFSGSRPDLTEEEATDPDYLQQALIPMSSETHSGEDVAVFARGPWSHLFGGVIEQNVIFHVMNHAVTAE